MHRDVNCPANDDAVKAIKLICSKIADAVIKGKTEAFSGEAGATKSGAKEEGEGAIEVLGSYTFEPEKPGKSAEPKESKGEIASP